MKISTVAAFILIVLFLSSHAFALFDAGTALDKGKLELDVAINPFDSIKYGQNFLFLHYGLGNAYEVHGYFSKWGTITNFNNSTYEIYLGVLKQWAEFEYFDFATSIGLRKVLYDNGPFSLIGPGVLYTFKVNKQVRVAGHLMFIGEILTQQNIISLKNYHRGYTSEVGLYYSISPAIELALGIFTNSEGVPRPIYTVNFYL